MFQFEEQLALPADKLAERESEKTVTRAARVRLTEVYGMVNLIGAKKSKTKSAALDLLRDADLAVMRFLEEYFSGGPSGPDGVPA